MITFDGVIFSSRNSRGGVSVYFRELVREAVLASKDVQILVHDRQFNAAELHLRPEQVVFRQPRLMERFRSLEKLPRGLAHSSYYRTCPQRSVRNVVTVYDFTYEKFITGMRALLHWRQKRAAILRADAVICISHSTKRDLQHFIPEYPPDRIFVTHLAASDQFEPLPSTNVSITTRQFVLFVGGRSDYKNFSAAVDAVRATGDYALVCVGGGGFTDSERAGLEAALPGRYFHAGAVDTAALNELYNAAVCLLYPSLYEGFGIPPLEAMQAGCPFIALNTSSLPEVAGEAGILLNDPDTAALAAAVDECAKPERRAQLRAFGFAQARKFSWGQTFAATLPIYQGLLASLPP